MICPLSFAMNERHATNPENSYCLRSNCAAWNIEKTECNVFQTAPKEMRAIRVELGHISDKLTEMKVILEYHL